MLLQMYIQKEKEEWREMGQKPEGGAHQVLERLKCSDEHRPNKTAMHNAETSISHL